MKLLVLLVSLLVPVAQAQVPDAGKVAPPAVAAGPAVDEVPAPAAQEEDQSADAAVTPAEFEASLHYQTGNIVLGDGLATLRLGTGLRYLDATDTQRVLEDAWGNPDGGGNLGMILPADTSPLADDSWGIVITYADDGHVADDGADDVDYDALLGQMQAAVNDESAGRARDGFETLTLVGWAEKPRYDHATHKMSWAKELAFGGDDAHTLNYNIRILGRQGVLVLNAVGTMAQLPLIRRSVPEIISSIDFNPGQAYMDYRADTDKLAPYGLAALVTGDLAPQPGRMDRLLARLLANKALIAAGAIIAALLWLLVRRRR